ncbi:MAG: flippase [Nanoarchaeota archaeon]|nr:flippase [Nanoarchaeota archaeon]
MDEHQDMDLDNSLKLIAKSSIIVFIGVILSKILTYIYRIIIAINYGPEIYGVFSLALMVLGWFVIFSRMGLPEGLNRYIPFYRGKSDKNKIKFIIKRTTKIISLMGVISGIVLFFSAKFIAINLFNSPQLTLFLKIFAIIVPFYVLFDTYLVILIAYEKVGWRSFIFNILQNLVRLLALIIFIYIGFSINAIAVSYIIGSLVGLVTAYFACKFLTKQAFGKYNLSKSEKKETFKNLFSYSWPLLFFGIIFSIFHWTDTLIIGLFTNAKQVGFYNAAVPIAMLLTFSSQIFIQLFFPFITRQYSKDKKNIKAINQLSKQISKWIFIINLPILILILIFPGVFINLLFKSQYLVAENALRFLSIGALFSSIFIVSNNLISMIGKSKVILIDIIIASVINIFLNVILVQSHGITGAAFATMVSLIVLNTLFLIHAKKYLSIVPLRRKMITIAFVTLIPTILLLLIRSKTPNINFLTMILLGFMFGLSYIILLFLTKSLDKNDMLILNAILKKLRINKTEK